MESLKLQLQEKSSIIEDFTKNQQKILQDLNESKKEAHEKVTASESVIKQEYLKREQVEKDLNKLDVKFNEVNQYLREEVERSTVLVQKNETLEAKYKKVKMALKEMANKLKELDEKSRTSKISDEQIKKLETLEED